MNRPDKILRPLLCFAFPFVLGVFAGQYILPDLWQPWMAAVILLLGSSLAWLWQEKRAFTAVIAAGLACGLLWISGYTALFLAPMEELVGDQMTVTLELAEYPEQREFGARCVVRVDGIPGKVMYYGDAELLSLAPGDMLSGTVKCHSAVEVGGKKSTYYTAQGIFLRLYPVGEMTVSRGDGGFLRYLPQQLERKLCTTVGTVFDEDTRGFILALLTGERDALDEQRITDLEESGLMHLTAVSGLHCGFLISLMSLLVANTPVLSAVVGYPILLLYMLVVGATPSVVRACVMVGFMTAAPLAGRENDAPTSLGAAALVILMANPYAISSVSFQLSFASVAGLLLVSPRIHAAINGLCHPKRRAAKALWAAFSASLSASISALVFTAPISAYYFRTVAVVSPLSNLLVFPVIQVLFACSLLLILVCAVLPGAAALAFIPELMTDYVLFVAGLTAKLPDHAVSFNSRMMTMWLLLVYAMLGVCWFSKDGRGKYILAAVLSVVSLFAARMLPVKLVENDTLTVVAVDVGQGAAALLHSGDTTALVDCGTHYSLRGSGACVVDNMRLYGWETLDYVVLTHYHKDHAGGVDELLARVSVETLLLPRATEEDIELHDEVTALASRYGVVVQYIDAVTFAPLGRACLTVYPQLTRGETNEEGLTVLCSAGAFDILITGDMSMSTERLLIDTYEIPDIEVLFVGHHGSKYSTSEDLLKKISPEVGIISVGENSYGHPTSEAMERMAFYGCTLYRTDWQGNIVIQVH